VWQLLHTSEPPEHQTDHREVDKGLAGGTEPLILATESAVRQEPSKRSFDDPPSGQHVEPWGGQVRPPNQSDPWEGSLGTQERLQRGGARSTETVQPTTVCTQSAPVPRPWLARTQPQMAPPWPPRPRRFVQNERDALTVHAIGGMDVDRQEQPFRSDQDVCRVRPTSCLAPSSPRTPPTLVVFTE
jgi:hypothetical protein